MFKKIGVLVVLCLLVVSCNKLDKPKKPDNLISKDKMAEVLYDLYIINAAKGVNKKLLETNGVIPETYILTKHNIDSLQFVDSNLYYTFHTDTYSAIIDKIQTRLEMEQAEFEALKKTEERAEKRKRDSLNRLKVKQRAANIELSKK